MLHRNTFEQAPIGIAYADKAGRFIRVNPAFSEMLGYTCAELENIAIGKLTFEADFGHNAVEIDRLWRGEIDSYSLEKRYLRKVGSPIWVRVTATLVLDETGAPNCSVGFLEAITDRKEAELELERTHKQLLDASRFAGMAEVAANVLHNVGNVLTSVNVSANLVSECVRDAKVAGLGRAAAMLKEREKDLAAFLTTDERGRKLPAYLTQLAEHLQGNQKLALKELAALRDNIEHIKETVAMQQSYAKLCGVSEIVAVNSLIEDSLRMNAAALARHGVSVNRETDAGVSSISVDKHKVLQILVNLIRNAKYACDDTERQDKQITIRVNALGQRVRIAVIDNGVGISPDNMSRLFRHGFTTRKTGHGFGLHSGALAAKELGGSLTAHSDGLGCGASFTLELPIEPPVESAIGETRE
jgi:PAS domain S-box-containing protein